VLKFPHLRQAQKRYRQTLTDHTNNKMTSKYFDKLLAEISKTGKPNIEDNEYISQFFIPINSTRNSILEEQDKIFTPAVSLPKRTLRPKCKAEIRKLASGFFCNPSVSVLKGDFEKRKDKLYQDNQL
jgi:hypothetical protein